MQNFSLKTSMAVSVSVLFVLYAAVQLFFALSFFEREEKDGIIKQQQALVTLLANTIDDKLEIVRKSLVATGSGIPPAVFTDQQQAEKFLSSKTTLSSLFDCGLYLFAPGGRLLASTTDKQNVSSDIAALRDFVSITATKSTPLISKPFLAPHVDGQPVVMLAVPIIAADGRVLGVLGGSIKLLGDNFLGDLATIRIGKSGYLYIYDRERTLIVHPDRSRIMKRDVPPGANRLFDQALKGIDGSGETVSSRGVRLVSSFKHLQDTDWILAVNYPLEEAYASIYKARRYAVIGMLLGTASLLVIVWLLMQRLTAPLLAMTRHVEGMAQKEGKDKLIAVDSHDEIGTLARAFNEMVRELETHQQILEERVHERTRELELVNRDLEAFNYSLSHDLRIPLNVIMGYCEMLREGSGQNLEAEDCQYLQEIELAGERMSELIEAMLEFSSAQRDQLHCEKVDLSGMFESVLAEFRLREPHRQVAIEIAGGLEADGDPRLLMAVFQNLVGNAWKFTRETAAAEISFGAFEQQGEKIYFLKDNGVGFDMDNVDNLFVPFLRLHTKKLFEGHGIGLATTQRIIQRHGGRIWAEGKCGAGATFFFTLGPQS